MRILLPASAILVGCTTAKAEDRRIKLISESSSTIVEFHASKCPSGRFMHDCITFAASF